MCEVQESFNTLLREGEDSRSWVFNLKFEVQGQEEQTFPADGRGPQGREVDLREVAGST